MTTTAQHATALVNCDTTADALAYAATLKGKTLAAVAAAIGAATYGPVADRRRQVVRVAIGGVLDSVAIRYHGQPDKRDAALAAYRARMAEKFAANTTA